MPKPRPNGLTWALACALMLGLVAVPALATGGRAAAEASSQAAAGSDQHLQVFIQHHFRLGSPADVELGPRKPSDIKGLFSRVVTLHAESGQTAKFILYTDAAQKTAIISDIDIGAATPGPVHGLWTRPLRAVGAPANSPPRSELITESPGKALVGSLLDLSKDPWGRVDTSKLRLADRATLGPEDAPVTIIEFGDFECPYCARAFGDIETVVNTTYKGKVRLIFKNFPLNIHPWAMQAALAAECVRRQNPKAFWPFADDIYRDQGEITPQNLREHVTGQVKKLGLDEAALDACIAGDSAEAQVNQDRADGNAIGVNSTPTFLVNGIELVGLPSDKTFASVIDSELKQREAKK
ncbi:MAG TPA: thioredoxin domain-containing protein [Candidatus Binataceae bacterium]|nr:thioredoxin domain-containing protein [Candidatus Binataceae bacterium]